MHSLYLCIHILFVDSFVFSIKTELRLISECSHFFEHSPKLIFFILPKVGKYISNSFIAILLHTIIGKITYSDIVVGILYFAPVDLIFMFYV